MDALSSHNDAERLKARHSLVALGRTALPSLLEALQSRHDLTRWEAVKALTEIGDPESAPALIKTLADEEFDIRWLAAVGLIGMNIKALKPLLHALMDQRDSHLMREGAHHVIHDLAKGELRKYLLPVLAALEGVDPATEVPGVAFRALEMLEKDHKL
jgi:HEAT repeat protein